MSVTHPTAGTKVANQYGTFRVHNATPAQVSYLRGLFETRDLYRADVSQHDFLDEAWTQLQAGVISKKNASRALDIVVPLPVRADAPKAVYDATDKQKDLIRKLLAEKDLTGTAFDAPAWLGGTEWELLLGSAGVGTPTTAIDFMTKRQASENIDELFKLPRLAKAGSGRAVEAGMYVAGTRIFRAYLGQQSGKILCKEVTADGVGGYTMEYLGLAAKHIPADARRMTLEEAKEWGRATGSCVKCGRRLDVPESVDAGIGPKCAQSSGW